METRKIIIYTDGGARGNPGPAACGYVIDGHPYGEYLGRATNNEAEYRGVIEALKKVRSLFGKNNVKNLELVIHMDSELVVKQLEGEYRVKMPHLKPLYTEVHNLIIDFKKVTFTHIPREKNKEADAMVNKILDSQQ